jgi:hypothetical protein
MYFMQALSGTLLLSERALAMERRQTRGLESSFRNAVTGGAFLDGPKEESKQVQHSNTSW